VFFSQVFVFLFLILAYAVRAASPGESFTGERGSGGDRNREQKAKDTLRTLQLMFRHHHDKLAGLMTLDRDKLLSEIAADHDRWATADHERLVERLTAALHADRVAREADERERLNHLVRSLAATVNTTLSNRVHEGMKAGVQNVSVFRFRRLPPLWQQIIYKNRYGFAFAFAFV